MEKLFKYLSENNLTLSSCESFTGGMFANEFTNIPGASGIFKGSFVCYTEEFKTDVLGVSEEVIKKYGLVSEEVTLAMVAKTQRALTSDITVAFNGFAPPHDKNNKQYGESFVGILMNGEFNCFEFKNKSEISREEYKSQAVKFILEKFFMLIELKK